MRKTLKRKGVKKLCTRLIRSYKNKKRQTDRQKEKEKEKEEAGSSLSCFPAKARRLGGKAASLQSQVREATPAGSSPPGTQGFRDYGVCTEGWPYSASRCSLGWPLEAESAAGFFCVASLALIDPLFSLYPC